MRNTAQPHKDKYINKTMKKNLYKFFLTVTFIVGLLILLYPTISNQWNRYRSGKLKSEYSQTVEKYDSDKLEREYQAAFEYNKTLIGMSVPDAFSIHESQKDQEYESLLNVNGNGMMCYVEIPSIDVSLPVYHYTSDEVLEKGAGHLAGSSLPVGGESTHVVISAHRGLPSAKMFTDINLLEIGDIFQIHILDRTLTYEVDQIKEVKPNETSDLSITEGMDYVTLLTCTPYGVNTERLLVRGRRIENPVTEDGKGAVVHNTVFHNPSVVMELLCVAIGILIAIVIVGVLGIKERKKFEQSRSRKEAEKTKNNRNKRRKNLMAADKKGRRKREK